MEAKQTAVDFMLHEISEIIGVVDTNVIQNLLLSDAYNRAKAMEKEQIEKAFHHSIVAMVAGKFLSPEQYYNETYGKHT